MAEGVVEAAVIYINSAELKAVESFPSTSISHYWTDTTGYRAIRAVPFVANRKHPVPSIVSDIFYPFHRLTELDKSKFKPISMQLKFTSKKNLKEYRSQLRLLKVA